MNVHIVYSGPEGEKRMKLDISFVFLVFRTGKGSIQLFLGLVDEGRFSAALLVDSVASRHSFQQFQSDHSPWGAKRGVLHIAVEHIIRRLHRMLNTNRDQNWEG